MLCAGPRCPLVHVAPPSSHSYHFTVWAYPDELGPNLQKRVQAEKLTPHDNGCYRIFGMPHDLVHCFSYASSGKCSATKVCGYGCVAVWPCGCGASHNGIGWHRVVPQCKHPHVELQDIMQAVAVDFRGDMLASHKPSKAKGKGKGKGRGGKRPNKGAQRNKKRSWGAKRARTGASNA